MAGLARPICAALATCPLVEEYPSDRLQVWFVTGASSGFGRAITEAAAEAGETVVAAVRRPAALAELAEKYPGLIDPVALDVTDPAAAESAIADAVARHGHIDVLVNNAGRTQVGAVEETTDDELRTCSTCTSSDRSRSPGRCCRTCASGAAGRS